jgi:ADP-heptose:LPS heptosyltransferase
MASVELPSRAWTRIKTPTQYGIEPDVHKIAVLRSNAIGDFIFTLPALEALRHAYPDAEIVLLGQDWHAGFLRGRPGPVDRVEVIPLMEGFDFPHGQEVDPAKVQDFFERMKAEKFDLAVQLHGGGRHSNPFIKRLGARVSVGSRAADAVPLDRWIPYAFFHLESLRQLEIVAMVGANPVTLIPRLAVTEQDLREADLLVPPSVSPLVVMHPGASDPRRRWPAENFASVGNSLVDRGAKVAVIGAGFDQRVVDAVTVRMEKGVINLCGQTTLGGLAGLLSRADLIISNDSGPLHMAAAVGTPGVGIYWVGNMITAGPLTCQNYHPLISWRMDCPVCGQDCMRNNCEHQESFVADVSTMEVLDAAMGLLELS